MKGLFSLATAAAAIFAQMAAGEAVSRDFLDRLPDADVLLLGEVHDNPVHHRLQARAVAAMAPAAVVWEMLTPEQAGLLPDDLADPELVSRAVGWEGTGWPDFHFYHQIMLAAGEALHMGAEVTRVQARRVFDEPLPSVSADILGDAAELFDLAQPLTWQDQATREAIQSAAHCDALPEHLLSGMVDAQRLRDAALATAVFAALDRTGGPVAVITGWGHARRDIGVPRKLTAAAPELRVLSMALLEEDPGENAPFDYWIVTDQHPREDPCAAFQ